MDDKADKAKQEKEQKRQEEGASNERDMEPLGTRFGRPKGEFYGSSVDTGPHWFPED
jgi:hypothetical protein